MNLFLNPIMPYVALIAVCMLFTIPMIWGAFFGKAVMGTLSRFLDDFLEKRRQTQNEREQEKILNESNFHLEAAPAAVVSSVGALNVLLPLVIIAALFFYGLNSARTDENEMAEAVQMESSDPSPLDAETAAADASPAEQEPPVAAVLDGKSLYEANCASCHQAGGGGIPGAFPPLAGSEWVTGEPEVIAKILLIGMIGEVVVAGNTYNGAMPAFGGALSDEELAEVITYVRSSWGNEASATDSAFIAETRAAIGSRTDPWSPAELKP